MADLSQTLLEDIRNRGADPFSMAYELTKIYAGTKEPEAKEMPTLFLELYEMFSTGTVASAKPKPAKKKSS